MYVTLSENAIQSIFFCVFGLTLSIVTPKNHVDFTRNRLEYFCFIKNEKKMRESSTETIYHYLIDSRVRKKNKILYFM